MQEYSEQCTSQKVQTMMRQSPGSINIFTQGSDQATLFSYITLYCVDALFYNLGWIHRGLRQCPSAANTIIIRENFEQRRFNPTQQDFSIRKYCLSVAEEPVGLFQSHQTCTHTQQQAVSHRTMTVSTTQNTRHNQVWERQPQLLRSCRCTFSVASSAQLTSKHMYRCTKSFSTSTYLVYGLGQPIS